MNTLVDLIKSAGESPNFLFKNGTLSIPAKREASSPLNSKAMKSNDGRSTGALHLKFDHKNISHMIVNILTSLIPQFGRYLLQHD